MYLYIMSCFIYLKKKYIFYLIITMKSLTFYFFSTHELKYMQIRNLLFRFENKRKQKKKTEQLK